MFKEEEKKMIVEGIKGIAKLRKGSNQGKKVSVGRAFPFEHLASALKSKRRRTNNR